VMSNRFVSLPNFWLLIAYGTLCSSLCIIVHSYKRTRKFLHIITNVLSLI
jgi:hypothetical protein